MILDNKKTYRAIQYTLGYDDLAMLNFVKEYSVTLQIGMFNIVYLYLLKNNKEQLDKLKINLDTVDKDFAPTQEQAEALMTMFSTFNNNEDLQDQFIQLATNINIDLIDMLIPKMSATNLIMFLEGITEYAQNFANKNK
jgi:hypothetical protein